MPNARIALVGLLCITSPIPIVAQVPAASLGPKPDFSKEASVVEDFRREMTFENDGTATLHEYQRIRIQSEAGVHLLGMLTFAYASGTGTQEIEFVRVHKPDGSTVETPVKDAQDMPSEVTRQAPFYSDIREKHLAVKGLGVGDVLEYKETTHVEKPLVPGQFWAEYSFTHNVIVLKEEFVVSVPRGRAVKVHSPGLPPLASEAGRYMTYTWSASNLERHEEDPKIAAATAVWEQGRGRAPQPDVQLTSFQSWEELGRWFEGLAADRVKPTPEVQAKAAELTKGLSDEDAKIRAIYTYVSTQFRYIGIAFGVGRYQPHFASEVLSNQYGDCKDKHALLAALLEAAGIKAYAALISSEHEVNEDVPSPLAFNHVITVIQRGANLMWLDSTTEVGPFQYLLPMLRGKAALVTWGDKPASFVTTPAEPPVPSLQEFQMDAALDGSGTLTGNAVLSVRGDLEVELRSAFRRTPMPSWKELAQRISMNLGFAGEVNDVSASPPERTEEPFRLSYKYVRKDFGDWPNRRVVVPEPFIGLPAMSSDLDKLKVPFWLGEKVTITFRSQLKLPDDYTLEAPAAIHVKNDFGEYDATYTLKDGTLGSVRKVKILTNTLARSDFTAYEHFCTTVQNDYQSFIQLASTRGPAPRPEVAEASKFVNALNSLPVSTNPEALRLENEGREAISRLDLQSATTVLYRATSADPKFARAWVLLGEVLVYSKQLDSGRDAFEKAIAAEPQVPAIQRIYAYTMMTSRMYDKAVPIWEAYIKQAPEDPDGPAYLGSCLMELKKYTEAVKAFESAVKLAPDRIRYQWQLASAYGHAGDAEHAIAIYTKLLETKPAPEQLHQAAYEMTLGDKTPSIALDLAEKSASAIEKESLDLDLGKPGADDGAMASKIASYWATLGRVQQRLGRTEAAEKTLTASWNLTQDGIAAAYLCELYEQQNKTALALRMCRRARNRLAMHSDPQLYDISQLIEQNNARLEKMKPGSSNNWNTSTIDEIAEMRDLKLPHVVMGTNTAEFMILAEFDPGSGRFKVTDTKYLNGSQKLKAVSSTLLKLNLNFTSPDGNPVRVVRWGTFLCADATGCEFILPDASAGRSQSIPFKVIK